jgi:hypothetical protein
MRSIRGFAGTDHDGSPSGGLGRWAGQHLGGVGRRYRRIEHFAQETARFVVIHRSYSPRWRTGATGIPAGRIDLQ